MLGYAIAWLRRWSPAPSHILWSRNWRLQRAWLELSIFLAAECQADPVSLFHTQRLRQQCLSSLQRLRYSPVLAAHRSGSVFAWKFWLRECGGSPFNGTVLFRRAATYDQSLIAALGSDAGNPQQAFQFSAEVHPFC